jgi:hypothetical protein
MAIKCSEGQVVYASPTEGIDFGGVTSCMTITCILTDGSKVAAHDAVYKRVKPHIIYVLKAKMKFLGKKAERVIAAGAGSAWTPSMQSQTELFGGMARADPSVKNLSDLQALNLMEGFLVSRNQDKFRDFLSRDLGVPKDKTEFTNHDFGSISVSAEGELNVSFG